MSRASATLAWRKPVVPVDPASPRPLWSVMIPAYNCAHHLRETIESVLDQDRGPGRMEITVVDDASGDDPRGVVEAFGRGRVGFVRHEQNFGHIETFQDCIERSRGTLVHLLHGDDTVRPGFYAALEAAFAERPEAGAAFCRSVYVDERGGELGTSPVVSEAPGLLVDAALRMAAEQVVMTPSIAVRRSAYEALGGFDRRLLCSEDWEMWMRIASRFPVWHEPRLLARYRLHAQSNTGRNVASARDIRYTRKAIAMFEAYLPADRAREVLARTRRTYAASALDTAARLLATGQRRGFWAQAREAVLLSPRPSTVLRALRLRLGAAKREGRP